MVIRICFWLLISTFSLSTHSQELAYPIRSSFSWAKVEKMVPATQVDQFIKATPQEFENFKQPPASYNSYNLDSLRRRLHFLDINGDGQLDVIFEGESGGEARIVKIYLNLGDSYKRIFADLQGVTNMDWRDGRLYKIYTFDWGCCDDYLYVNKIFQVTYKNTNKPEFVKMYQSTYVEGTYFPRDSLEKPFRFEVLNDNYNIRSVPVVDDTSRFHFNDGQPHGNVIAKLPRGARGTAMAKKMDATGREWWYVEIDEEFYPSNEVFLKEEQNDFPTKIIGWISSRFAKVI